jgi:two-component system, OmpR family, response regulator ChvI
MDTKRRRRRILIVDDEPDITSVFKLVLADTGFEVDVFNDPLVALSNFKTNSYDLLLLDIRMPKMNGFELYQKIKEIDDKVKVCFMTAFDVYHEEFKKEFPTSDEVKYFIRKPIAIADLVKHVESILS